MYIYSFKLMKDTKNHVKGKKILALTRNTKQKKFC